jgi:predicted TIM-barrel fold metal-dependent hydrolase
VRLADMDAGGIDTQIVCLGAAQPYFADESKAVEGAQLANDLARQLIVDHPGRFSAFGAIPLPHPSAAVAEVERCLDELGFAGICMGCSAGGVPIDDDFFQPVWEALNDRQGVVYLHPGAAIDGIVGCRDHHLAPDFVSPSEIAVTAARLVVNGVLDRYPDVSVILATTGGTLPFFARRFDRGLKQNDRFRHQEIGGFLPHLKRFFYDTSVLEEPLVLRTAYELVGADRLMLGSDYARPGVTSAAAVDYVASAEYLSPEERDSILGGNAEKLFGPLRTA